MNRAKIAGALLALGTLAALLALSSAASSDSSSPTSTAKTSGTGGAGQTAAQTRQGAATMLGTLGSLVPSLITNVAPLVLLAGLGALMVPSLSAGAMGLLRESRRSGPNDQLAPMQLPNIFAQFPRPLQTSPQDLYFFSQRSFPGLMSSLNSAALIHGVRDILERVDRAIENADRRYS